MTTNEADEAYIIRSDQKDLYHLQHLRTLAEPVLRSLLGSRFFDTHGGSANVALLTVYTAITTGLGRRTLGEEYTNIHKWKGNRSLSWQMRLLLVFSIPAPHILKYLLSRSRRNYVDRFSPTVRNILKSTLELLVSDTTWDIARTLNLIAFYLGSKFHTIKNRIFNIRYIDTSASEQPKIDKPFEILGYMLAIRLAIQVASLAKPYLPKVPSVEVPIVAIDGREVNLLEKNEKDEIEDNDALKDEYTCISQNDIADPQRKCILCLETRKATSAMLCGHLYCWYCLDNWLREKNECPLCRQHTALKDVIPVYNI